MGRQNPAVEESVPLVGRAGQSTPLGMSYPNPPWRIGFSSKSTGQHLVDLFIGSLENRFTVNFFALNKYNIKQIVIISTIFNYCTYEMRGKEK